MPRVQPPHISLRHTFAAIKIIRNYAGIGSQSFDTSGGSGKRAIGFSFRYHFSPFYFPLLAPILTCPPVLRLHDFSCLTNCASIFFELPSVLHRGDVALTRTHTVLTKFDAIIDLFYYPQIGFDLFVLFSPLRRTMFAFSVCCWPNALHMFDVASAATAYSSIRTNCLLSGESEPLKIELSATCPMVRAQLNGHEWESIAKETAIIFMRNAFHLS